MVVRARILTIVLGPLFGLAGGSTALASSLTLKVMHAAFTLEIAGRTHQEPVDRKRRTMLAPTYSSTGEVVSSNLRFRWEYTPGSELFFVYTDERNALSPRFSELRNRAIVLKINRLWQF